MLIIAHYTLKIVCKPVYFVSLLYKLNQNHLKHRVLNVEIYENYII